MELDHNENPFLELVEREELVECGPTQLLSEFEMAIAFSNSSQLYGGSTTKSKLSVFLPSKRELKH